MSYLLDANVLIALVNPKHVHHERARTWFAGEKPEFATCPITQGALIRHYFRDSEQPTAPGAVSLIQKIEALSSHRFWPDTVSYAALDYTGVIGHRQVTDAYLVALVKEKQAKLATMDRGLNILYPNHTHWITEAKSQ